MAIKGRIFKAAEIKLNSMTEERVVWDMVLIDDKNGTRNRNNAVLNPYTFVMDNDEAKSLGVNFNHATKYFGNTTISDLQAMRKDGVDILIGRIESTNKEVIEKAGEVTSPSVEFYVDSNDVFLNSEGKEMYQRIDFKGVALLLGETQGAGGARVREFKKFSMAQGQAPMEIVDIDGDTHNNVNREFVAGDPAADDGAGKEVATYETINKSTQSWLNEWGKTMVSEITQSYKETVKEFMVSEEFTDAIVKKFSELEAAPDPDQGESGEVQTPTPVETPGITPGEGDIPTPAVTPAEPSAEEVRAAAELAAKQKTDTNELERVANARAHIKSMKQSSSVELVGADAAEAATTEVSKPSFLKSMKAKVSESLLNN